MSYFLFYLFRRHTIPSILIGKWNNQLFYKGIDYDLKIDNFMVEKFSSLNYLRTEYNNEFAYISLSSNYLSGNITYKNKNYSFNFDFIVSPYKAADIKFDEYNAHVTLISYKTIKALLMNKDGNSNTYLFTKDYDCSYSKNILSLILILSILILFIYITKSIRKHNKVLIKREKID